MANEKQTGGGERGRSGNFANDPQRASEAGKKGGHAHGGASQQDQGTSKSESGGSSQEKAGKAGRKGGEHSHGGK